MLKGLLKKLKNGTVSNENNRLINNSPYSPYGDMMTRGMTPKNELQGRINYSLPTKSNLNKMQMSKNKKPFTGKQPNAQPFTGRFSADKKEIFYPDGTSERLDARPIKGGREAVYPDGTSEMMYSERIKRRKMN